MIRLGVSTLPSASLIVSLTVALLMPAAPARGQTQPPAVSADAPAATPAAAPTAPVGPEATPPPAPASAAPMPAPAATTPAPAPPLLLAAPAPAAEPGTLPPLPPPEERPPIYQQTWFWAVVGVVALTAVMVAYGLGSQGPATPATDFGNMRAF
jgi:hypothetical protein